jgi:hypothetical protein
VTSAARLLAILFSPKNPRHSVNAWCIVCIVCAALLAWAGRHQLNPDGLSYLDIASRAAAGAPGELISGYWSPAYPALIAAVFWIARPSPAWEVPALHLVNFLVFLFVLWAFRSLVVEVLGLRKRKTLPRDTPLIPFAFATVLCLTVEFLDPAVVTPDLLALGCFCIVCKLAWRFTANTSLRRPAAIGLALAACYYARTAMFLLALVLLVLFVAAKPRLAIAKATLVCALVWLAATAPLIFLISRKAGHATIGEAGTLNYIWYVNHRENTPYIGWNGSFGSALPLLAHPPHVVASDPLTLEFASPVGGTFPIWYAPDYWWAGLRPHFDAANQVLAVKDNLRAYLAMLPWLSPWICGIAAMLFLGRGRRTRRRWSWQIAWSCCALIGFALIHVEGRFVAPFLLLIWLTLYRAQVRRLSPPARALVPAAVTAALLLIAGEGVSLAAYRTIRDAVHPRAPESAVIARELQALDLKPGDSLAVVGYAFNAYYARYARMRIAAQVQDETVFWKLSPGAQASLADRLAGAGVKALVARDRPPSSDTSAWHDVDVPSGRVSVLLLSAASHEMTPHRGESPPR